MMKMYNFEVQSFSNFLMEQSLAGKESRMRTKFVKLAVERLDEIEKDRVELIREYAEKDDEGELIIVNDDDGQSSYKIIDTDGFNREYNILMGEEFIVDETIERKEMLATVRFVVLNTESVFSGNEAIQYDRWCEIVLGE